MTWLLNFIFTTGNTEFTKLAKKQVLIGNLTNGYQYAFTVQVVNSVGMSYKVSLSFYLLLTHSILKG